MKQTNLLKTFLLLCALIVGSTCAWAADVTLAAGTNGSACTVNGNDGIKVGTSKVGGDMTITVPANTTTLHFHAAAWKGVTGLSLNITGATVNPESVALTADDGISNNSPFTLAGDEDDFEFEITLSNITTETTLKLESSTNKRFVVWGASADVSGGGGQTETCATPTFSLAEGVYTSAQNVTISTTTEGATIYYTTNGDTPTTSSSVYSSAINVSTTTTIKAIAVKEGNNNSAVASATYTILEHAGTQADPYTVADARIAIDANNGIENVYVTGIVCTGGSNLSSGSLIYWISDDGTESNKLEAYKGKNLNNTDFTATTDVKVGDVVVIYGSLTKYNSTYEFTAGNYLVSHKVKPATPTFSPVASTYTSAQNVTISCTTEGAAIYYTTDGTTPTSASTLYTAPINVSATTTIKAIAINDGLSSDVATAEFVIDLTPFVLLDENSIEATTAEKEGTITVTYGNLTDVIADVEFYEADGTTPATYDHSWIVADINSSNNMDYVIAENTLNVVRKAYIKVYAIGNEGEARSELITVTQAAADYASLPFSFNGGLSASASTLGLTQSGLGGDYKSAPKLKFDTSGDYLILNFKETPASLSFDIKGNGSGSDPWDGTFIVQTSADGENYTDLKAYTELGATETESFALASTVRYIKWIYTEKKTGNVALGNISLKTDGVVPVTISAAGLATFASDSELDFTNVDGIEAYIAKENGTKIELEKVNKVPAGTGVLLRSVSGEAKAADVPVTAAAADAVTGNLFVRGTGAAVESGSGPYNYVLGKHEGKVGFYKAGGMTVATDKAYLQTTVAAARIDIDFDGDVTAIETVKAEKANNEYFNLAGQRVANPTKGLYIVNGRKVVVK